MGDLVDVIENRWHAGIMRTCLHSPRRYAVVAARFPDLAVCWKCTALLQFNQDQRCDLCDDRETELYGKLMLRAGLGVRFRVCGNCEALREESA